MKILVFTEGTIIMHKHAVGVSRAERIRQVKENEETVNDFVSYVPIGNSVEKLNSWVKSGAEISYLTSRRREYEIQIIQDVLVRHNFPRGQLFFRNPGEKYKEIAERIVPDVLIEDDCESIGGKEEMTITHVRYEIRDKIKSIPVKEFGGVDHLPDNCYSLLSI